MVVPAGDSDDEWDGDDQGFSGSLVLPLCVRVSSVFVFHFV